MVLNEWDADNGIAQCIVSDSKNGITIEGFGMATCHENDKAFQSELTGSFIAQTRAYINILRNKRDYDIKPGLMALKHVRATMVHSHNYNPSSYEAKRLSKEIKNLEDSLHELNCVIEEEKKMLKEYLNDKDKIYRELEHGQN